MSLAVDIAWLLGGDAELVLRQRRHEVAEQLLVAHAHALVELEEGDALTELLTRALCSMSTTIYTKTLARRGDLGRESCIDYCGQALRAFYALESIGGVK